MTYCTTEHISFETFLFLYAFCQRFNILENLHIILFIWILYTFAKQKYINIIQRRIRFQWVPTPQCYEEISACSSSSTGSLNVKKGYPLNPLFAIVTWYCVDCLTPSGVGTTNGDGSSVGNIESVGGSTGETCYAFFTPPLLSFCQ